MQKTKEKFVFFHINDAAAFKSVLKTYAAANITSIATLMGPTTAQPQAFVNLAFSQFGLTALGVTDNLGDAVFTNGQFADAGNLGDDTSTWDPAFAGTNVHGVFLIGSDDVSLSPVMIVCLSDMCSGFNHSSVSERPPGKTGQRLDCRLRFGQRGASWCPVWSRA